MRNKYMKRYLLEKIRADDREYKMKTKDNFQVSEGIVNECLLECLKEDLIEITSESSCGYRLVTEGFEFIYEKGTYFTEDMLLSRDVLPCLDDVSDEAKLIWEYAFSEMMNNAIEHSGYQTIHYKIKKDCLYSEIVIIDDGIGIFKNIQTYLEEHWGHPVTYQDVQIELYKGKMTTDPENHSGEGIFFTSKMLKRFAVWSEEAVFWNGYDIEEQFIQSHLIAYCTKLSQIGTMVVMQLENDSERKIGDIFGLYVSVDEGFVKTVIPIGKVCTKPGPVARSQARKILYRLDRFKYVELDFTGVEYMGQGFADEVFRVFRNKCPSTKITAVNGNPAICGMIRYVQAG